MIFSPRFFSPSHRSRRFNVFIRFPSRRINNKKSKYLSNTKRHARVAEYYKYVNSVRAREPARIRIQPMLYYIYYYIHTTAAHRRRNRFFFHSKHDTHYIYERMYTPYYVTDNAIDSGIIIII